MENVSKFIADFFNRDVTGGYAILFLLFIASILAFIVWLIYYATRQDSREELSKVTWISLKKTTSYTLVTVASIVVMSLILFSFDFGIDKIVNIIIENAK